ncbi:hypothetical protein [Spirillospora sp. NPDC047279]|uniref:hypothetical protein n=1 Tax=Spirillospora sp. NPDC047279 TaxID=3155478 RepID=UPI0033E9BA3D
MNGMCAEQQGDRASATDAVPESVRDAVESVRVALWRDHAVRSAEREVAEQWLKRLRSRLRFAFEEWQAVRHEREAFQRELEKARAGDDRGRVAALTPLAEQARANDLDAHQRYRLVANAVVTEMCRIREAIIGMNRDYLAQIRDLQLAIDTVDAALGLPLPPVTRHPDQPPRDETG